MSLRRKGIRRYFDGYHTWYELAPKADPDRWWIGINKRDAQERRARMGGGVRLATVLKDYDDIHYPKGK